MEHDIVTRLRKQYVGHYNALLWYEAADEIERLRRNTGCARNQRTTQFCAEALDAQREIDRLRVERDEARRELLSEHIDPVAEAKRRGWDCLKEGWDCGAEHQIPEAL